MLKRMCENVIKSGQYETEDMQMKLDAFLVKQRLTLIDYDYLCNLMIEFPPIVLPVESEV